MRKAAILAAAAAVLMPLTASSQAALRVQPLLVDVSSPSAASSLTLQNNGSEELSLQLRVFEWSQVDGHDQLVPTNDVVASPPVARIPAGSNFTIRVARTAGAAAAGTEKSYRLWVDELPPPSEVRDEGGKVEVRLRFDLPIFFHDTNSAPQVSWTARRVGSEIVLTGTNASSRHARIEGLKLQGSSASVSFGEGLNGYVLGNSTRSWSAPTPSPDLFAGGGATVVSGAGGSETRQTVTLAN
ncbi:molecular chaperone [Altererythrobacter sp. Root672]|uniref:fimbrial biogenesis chaperone n=1 Tax=Altererythrobacter sp. Root672 TaxID=1736584 RepID=UPI0006F3F2C0|nr:fimbria/pilus periplasmic chaperone [Altererythrobacter sp. Root672]KRA83627.1 hypothetical protein ASD76_06235 [Altererythrobacter sp. Root672]